MRLVQNPLVVWANHAATRLGNDNTALGPACVVYGDLYAKLGKAANLNGPTLRELVSQADEVVALGEAVENETFQAVMRVKAYLKEAALESKIR